METYTQRFHTFLLKHFGFPIILNWLRTISFTTPRYEGINSSELIKRIKCKKKGELINETGLAVDPFGLSTLKIIVDMKVQHDTGWDRLIDKALSENPVDKLEETNPDLSKYSSESNRTYTSRENNLWKIKDRQFKLKKRHRFPPSLLSSRAADLWNTLMPLRGNCSCSSVSEEVESSRFPSGVSLSDTTVRSFESLVSPFDKVASPKTLVEILEHTHEAFELLIARMVRLTNILNEEKDSSSVSLFSESNLEILSPLSQESESTGDIIVGDICRRFPSVTSLSNNSTNRYHERLLPDRIERRWQSSSKFEIPERRNRLKSQFFSSALPSQSSFGTKGSALTEEELVYLLQNKRSLISEYFQCKFESEDLKEKLDSSEPKSLISVTQSDFRLQEGSLIEFIQFIRARIRKKQEAEYILTENLSAIETPIELESRKFSIPKRRVTFSDPLTDDSKTLLDTFSFEDEEISSIQSFATSMTDDAEKESEYYPESEVFIESESPSPSNSSVSLKTCFANFDPKIVSTIPDDPEIITDFSVELCESMTVKRENEIEETDHSRYNIPSDKMTGREEPKVKVEIVSEIPVKKPVPSLPEDRLIGSLRSTLPSSLTLRSFDDKPVKVTKKKKKNRKCLKFLVKEALDRGTTHVPLSDEKGESLRGDDGVRRVTFEGCSQEENAEGHFGKINTCQVLVPGKCSFIIDENSTWNREFDNGSIVSKSNDISEISVHSSLEELGFVDPEFNCRYLIPSGKTVKFQDYCQTINDRSIARHSRGELFKPSSRSDEILASSSVDNGRFEFAWKGSWEQERPIDLDHTEFISRVAVQPQREESEQFFAHQEPLATPYSCQSSCYTTLEDLIELTNDYRSEYECNYITANASESEQDEIREDISKAYEPMSKFNNNLQSNPEIIDSGNRSYLAREFDDICKEIRNPEIWRSEIQTLARPDWYTSCNCDGSYSSKKCEPQSDWLIRRLRELRSSPDVDCESDYHADSDVDSDFEWARNLSLVKRSLSDIDAGSECRQKFRTMAVKERRGKKSLLDKVWSGGKVFVRGCRCKNNPPSPKFDLRQREPDPGHTSFRNSEERSSRNVFSHLRSRIIVDSETEDSDFSPSFQPKFIHEFNRKDEYVDKIKCRRFVKSLKSVGGSLGIFPKSRNDRQFSSSELLHVAFQKSFSPASVQTELSTRTTATNVSEEQDHCSVIDVCIDTVDLCPRKSIGTMNRASDFISETNEGTCQTMESFLDGLNSLKSTESSKETPPRSNSEEYRESGQKLSSAIASLSVQINDASNNLAKLRFSEVETTSEDAYVSPAIMKENFHTSASRRRSFHETARSSHQASSPISQHNNSGSRSSENLNCPICKTGKNPAARYVLPACVVKGAFPDPRTNEKDPWNRVVERAKVHRHCEERNAAKSSISVPSWLKSDFESCLRLPGGLKFSQNKQNSVSVSRESFPRKEFVGSQPPRVKDNSVQADCVENRPAALAKDDVNLHIESFLHALGSRADGGQFLRLLASLFLIYQGYDCVEKVKNHRRLEGCQTAFCTLSRKNQS